MYRLLICINFGLLGFSYAQDSVYLYYAQPDNTALYLGLVYMSEENTVLVGEKKLFLLNYQRLIVDTLLLAQGGDSFLDNVNNVTVIDKETLSVSTLRMTILLKIKWDEFHIQKKYYYDELKAKVGLFDIYVLLPKGLLVRNIIKKKNEIQHYYFSKAEGEEAFFRLNGTTILSRPVVAKHRGSEIIGFSKYQINGKFLYIFNRKQNVLNKLDTTTGQVSEILLPPIDSNRLLHEFYVDHVTGLCYLVAFFANGVNKVFLLSDGERTFKEVFTTPYTVRAVFNGKCYVAGLFDNAQAHFLIPIKPLQGSDEQ